MKNIIYVTIFILLFSCSNKIEVGSNQWYKSKLREDLKEYFVYKSIWYALKYDSLKFKESTGYQYKQVVLISYTDEAFHIVDSVAKQFVQKIKPGGALVGEYGEDAPVSYIYWIFNERKTKRLDEFIHSMDKYMREFNNDQIIPDSDYLKRLYLNKVYKEEKGEYQINFDYPIF